jgi:Ribbon-helix-helix protein
MSGKTSGLRIRVEKALRDEFLDACHARDLPAAQVIREFMRDYVARNDAANEIMDNEVNQNDRPIDP